MPDVAEQRRRRGWRRSAFCTEAARVRIESADRWGPLLFGGTLAVCAIAAVAVGQTMPAAVVAVVAVSGTAFWIWFVRGDRSRRARLAVALSAILVLVRVPMAVADGYLADRNSRCHPAGATARQLVHRVAPTVNVDQLVAVQWRFVTFAAGRTADGRVPAFGISGHDIVAVNEAARAVSTAKFDFYYGTGGVIVITSHGQNPDLGRQLAMIRVAACASPRERPGSIK